MKPYTDLNYKNKYSLFTYSAVRFLENLPEETIKNCVKTFVKSYDINE
jgi:hypothetical protein